MEQLTKTILKYPKKSRMQKKVLPTCMTGKQQHSRPGKSQSQSTQCRQKHDTQRRKTPDMSHTNLRSSDRLPDNPLPFLLHLPKLPPAPSVAHHRGQTTPWSGRPAACESARQAFALRCSRNSLRNGQRVIHGVQRVELPHYSGDRDV